jgi:beta-lactam-binding protein with PASTA domain/tRNA A-37 threonylcarbamoyl transferase component Bud32
VQRVEPDTIIDGRYRVLRRLGSGGMADVYCAEDQQLGRKVALKVLYRRFAEDQQFVERFRREASAAAGLQHPSIVGIFDRGEWDGTYYIAMEFIEGRSLKEIIRGRGPAPPDAATDIAVQILRALRFAHRRGVVHRDIKPHNVLIDDEGRVKVADFGIARAGASDMTETGSIMGTAQYLSPEQAQGRPVDARSDLYSVGIVLYEMLTGRVPFDAESAVTVALMQVSSEAVPPSELNPAIPPALEAVVLRAMAKEPERRFADADEFIAALEHARSAPHEVLAPPPPVVPLEEEERGRGRWWLWLLGLLALAAIAVGLYLTLRPEQLRVPNVVGLPEATAAQAVQNRGFEVEVEPRTNPDVERGTVAAQDPRPNTMAEEGSTVTLIVSTGPGEAAVPTVVGMPRREAERAVRDAGFRVDVERVYSDEVDEGLVISTSPPEGTSVELGTTVTLRVSRGPEPVQVPAVIGQSEEDARSALEGAGLTVETNEQESEDEEPGTVLAQDPEAGAAVRRGSSVTITVAVEPEPLAIPDVIGDQRDAAEASLDDAGFEVRVREEDTEEVSQDGVVLDQNPSGGEERPEGTRVTIVVGRLVEPEPEPSPSPSPSPTVGPGA